MKTNDPLESVLGRIDDLDEVPGCGDGRPDRDIMGLEERTGLLHQAVTALLTAAAAMGMLQA